MNFCARVKLLRENGLTEQWLTDYFNYNRKRLGTIDQKLKEPIIEFIELSFKNTFDLFYLLFCGLIIAFLVFFIETLARSIEKIH